MKRTISFRKKNNKEEFLSRDNWLCWPDNLRVIVAE